MAGLLTKSQNGNSNTEPLFLGMGDLKEKLIKKILETTDPEVLKEMLKILDNQFDDKNIYQLTDDQKSVVNEAQEQIAKGEYLNNNEANQEIEKWLRKK
ncbi:MAG: hypothetical protein NXI20_19395 [bacterium]|nr:hypothetical protein [bacterium]